MLFQRTGLIAVCLFLSLPMQMRIPAEADQHSWFDCDHDSCLILITVPGRKRSPFRGQADQ